MKRRMRSNQSILQWYVDVPSHGGRRMLHRCKFPIADLPFEISLGEGYIIAQCEILACDKKRFEAATNDLAAQMLMMGYCDYPERCKEAAEIMKRIGEIPTVVKIYRICQYVIQKCKRR